MKLKTICITVSCAHVCTLNALHRHFMQSHMNATYTICDMGIVETPAVNDVEESAGELEEEDYESKDGVETAAAGCRKMRRTQTTMVWLPKLARWITQKFRKRGTRMMMSLRGKTTMHLRGRKLFK
jgi:hypothetical protein